MLTIRGRLITTFVLGSMSVGLNILIRHSFMDLWFWITALVPWPQLLISEIDINKIGLTTDYLKIIGFVLFTLLFMGLQRALLRVLFCFNVYWLCFVMKAFPRYHHLPHWGERAKHQKVARHKGKRRNVQTDRHRRIIKRSVIRRPWDKRSVIRRPWTVSIT